LQQQQALTIIQAISALKSTNDDLAHGFVSLKDKYLGELC
jgi:hypothetical protein